MGQNRSEGKRGSQVLQSLAEREVGLAKWYSERRERRPRPTGKGEYIILGRRKFNRQKSLRGGKNGNAG